MTILETDLKPLATRHWQGFKVCRRKYTRRI